MSRVERARFRALEVLTIAPPGLKECGDLVTLLGGASGGGLVPQAPVEVFKATSALCAVLDFGEEAPEVAQLVASGANLGEVGKNGLKKDVAHSRQGEGTLKKEAKKKKMSGKRRKKK